ncbi:hypothetical protein B0G76_1337 [Paraburkholderia sp. BL23I1N1]|uniref:hypothetical protein n=1 Tax=Paraburkholderia sp. BL23I1N1 TaxID=1938802 RepID=UPI000E73707E|nr:hypothetical protein [Paraburkholderia sp. BL23I1N1]RKE35276.1 hypothetical protein B0G76_1337 [Paraburkholderia sp. BL23I1N1]
MTLLFILALNFAVSWFNCYSIGGIWTESKALGGFPRLLAWCGAIQAAIGFSSVFGFLMGYALHVTGHLPPQVATGAMSLWYLLVIVPLLGTGLIITIQSWIAAFRERSLLNMGTAAYNTFAQLHNMYGAIDGIADAMSGVGRLFDGDSEDSGGALALFAIALAVAALASGIVLTVILIRRYAGRLPLPQREVSKTAARYA